MTVGFIITYAINTYHHKSWEFESRSWWDVLDTILCDKVCQWLAAGRWFSQGSPVSPINKTDRHDISEILLSGVKHHTPNPLKHNRLSVNSLIEQTNSLYWPKNSLQFVLESYELLLMHCLYVKISVHYQED
jgi:hypothetical protein